MPSRASTVNGEPLRRSPRSLNAQKPRTNLEISPEPLKRVVMVIGLKAEVSRKSAENSRNLRTGSARSLVSSDGFKGVENIRRSPRLVDQKKAKQRAEASGEDGSSSRRVSSSRREVSKKSSNGSRNCGNFGDDEVNGTQELRRSSRVYKNQNPSRKVKNRDEEKFPEKCTSNGGSSDIGSIVNRVSSKSTRNKVLADARKVGSGRNLCEQYKERAKGIVCGDVVNPELAKGREDNGAVRKRKREKDCNGVFQGWTDKQEKALQRAYFSSKPTPHFWKKVSKLVPGKSAQECFDKIHSIDVTPQQPPPRSRVKKPDASSTDFSSLSASKLLLSTKLNGRRPISNRRKNHFAQKTVRHMLQKHYHVDVDYEADLFSVLEPDTDPSASNVPPPTAILSTPEHLLKKQGFLQKCFEKSSSGRKKPISRFISSCGNALVSPPVLKQVKNRAMHEKYIDLLHCREAKRKTVSAREKKFFTGKEDPEKCNIQKMDVVRAAKVALVSEARDAISQLQRLEANAVSNSLDLGDDEIASNDEDGGEDET